MMPLEYDAAAAARDEGMANVENASLPHHIAAVDAEIAKFNEIGMPWSANDLRDSLPPVRKPLVGSRVTAASMRRPLEMVKVGEIKSSLPSTHTKKVGVWLGIDAAIAAGLVDAPTEGAA